MSQAAGEASPPDPAATQPSTAKKAERKLNLKERLELCVASEGKRLTFGKVCPLLPALSSTPACRPSSFPASQCKF